MQRKMPILDILVAVDNLKAFHKANMKANKTDYTYLARMTHGLPVTFFQTKGARVHFNHTQLELPQSKEQIKIRYGVVEYADMLRDMRNWETMVPSTFMQRPHEVLICADEQVRQEIHEAQEKNLTSAFAFAALTAPRAQI